jgi:hypothetical protein
LVALGFGFPLSDGGVKGACSFYGGLEKFKAMVWIGRNNNLHKLLFDLLVVFELGGGVLS